MTGATTTLIVTADDDSTADLVNDALAVQGGKAVRIDVGDFPISLSVTGTIGDDGIWCGEVVATDGTVLDLGTIDAVYYRRPTRFRLPDHLSPADRRFAEAEAHRGLGGLLTTLPARWVSHPARIADAEAKPGQLQLAAACGFRLPRTLISNDPDRVRGFAGEITGPLVYKPLSSGILREPDGLRAIYATRIEAAGIDDWLDPDAIRLAPHQFQECVTDKAYDLRVTAVGDRLFPIAIHTADPEQLDWRTDYGTLTYQHVELRTDVAAVIHRYLAAAGLAFGAFDFIMDQAGMLWWMECNPNGEWGWLTECIDVPIAEALAELLLGQSPL
ncbi:MAG: MvdC/MvdD family ATP grasp protein [Pseudonocardiaceae bacterium]